MLLEESAADQFSDIDTTDPNCVLVGLSPSSFHYDKLNQAFKLGMYLVIIPILHNHNPIICDTKYVKHVNIQLCIDESGQMFEPA